MDWREQSDRDLYLSRTLDHSRGGLVHLFTIYWPEVFRGNLEGSDQPPFTEYVQFYRPGHPYPNCWVVGGLFSVHYVGDDYLECPPGLPRSQDARRPVPMAARPAARVTVARPAPAPPPSWGQVLQQREAALRGADWLTALPPSGAVERTDSFAAVPLLWAVTGSL